MNLASRVFAVVACSALAAAGAAVAQQRPGVGYDPQGRGLSLSRYQLDTLSSPFLSHAADFTADPGAVGSHPNAYQIVLSDPAVAAAYERRYGPFTSTNRFKRWAGPGNEVRFLLKNALVWFFENHPESLGGDAGGRNGEPTEVEITDVQAFNDHDIWMSYFQAELTGFSAGNRVTVCDASVPAGDGEIQHPFWGVPYYYTNVFAAPLPVSPQVPGNGCPPGIGSPDPAFRPPRPDLVNPRRATLSRRSGALDFGGVLADDLHPLDFLKTPCDLHSAELAGPTVGG